MVFEVVLECEGLSAKLALELAMAAVNSFDMSLQRPVCRKPLSALVAFEGSLFEMDSKHMVLQTLARSKAALAHVTFEPGRRLRRRCRGP